MLRPKFISFSTSAMVVALIRRHDTLLIASAVLVGIILAITFIALGLPWLLTGRLP